MKKLLLLFVMQASFFLNAEAHEWIQTNGPYGADVMALATGPDDKLYAGTTPMYGPGGGVFKSEDNGDHWAEMNRDLLSFLNCRFL
jgi:hypothetical protein